MDKDEDQARKDAPPADSAETRPIPDEGPSTGEVRIDAQEAGVIAGLGDANNDDDTVVFSPDSPGISTLEPTEAYELPDWADPPTGQVPRILLENPDAPEHNEPVVRGPSWREEGSDWDDNLDLSLLASDEEDLSQIAGAAGPPSEAPFEFAFAEVDDLDEAPVDTPWQPMLDDVASRRRARRRAHRRRPQREHRGSSTAVARSSAAPRRRSWLVASATGVAVALLAALCFSLGAVASLALVVVVLVIAAGEAFAALQRGGYEPATLVGLAAVPALVIGAYLRGPQAIVIIAGLTVLLSLLWYLRKPAAGELIGDLGATLLVVCWVGVLGAFVGLLLAPSSYPDRHGVAFVVALVVLTATHDVGAYAVGSRLGRRRLAPQISPGKTVEGLLGATVLVLLVAGLAISHVHPFHLGSALELGLVVAVFAPLGDLVESLIKRDLDIKDMGTLLPAHGGVLDRIDAMLFVVVPAYYLVRLVHL